MIEFPQETPLGKSWAVVSDRDLFDAMKYGNILGTSGIDLSTNLGRIQLGRRMVLNTSTLDVAQITAPLIGFNLCGTHIYAGAGVANVGYMFKNDGTLIGTFAIDQSTNLTSSMTTGSGLNDLSLPTPTAGTFGSPHTYVVTVTSGTPDKFSWTKDGVSGGTNVNITGGNQTLDLGVVIKFAATTGHTTGNAWTILLNTAPNCIDSTTSDQVFANNTLYVSELDGSQLYLCQKIGDQPWGARISVEADSVGYPHMMVFFQGRVYITNSQSKMVSIDSSGAVTTSGVNSIILNGIIADFSNVITRPFVSANTIFIPCVNTTGEKGAIYEWDGVATSYQKKHLLNNAGILTGCDYYDVPYVLDVEGNLLSWNGYAFKTVASFYRKTKKLLYNPISLVNNRFSHPNSMKVVGDKIRFIIDNRNNDSTYSIEETITAGIYEFDPVHPEKGIYNIEPFGMSKAADTIIDHGALRIAGAGALASLNLPSTSATRNGTMLASVGYYLDATTPNYGIFYDDINDTLQKAGSIIFLKVDSAGVKDLMTFLRVMYGKLKDTADKIVLKYIYEDSDPVEATITWVNSQAFTVPNSQIDLTNYLAAVMGANKGAEVEVIHGRGAGKCAHITSASLVAGTWTVATDETFTSASGTAQARFKKWIWLGEANYAEGNITKKVKPDRSNNWFMVKLWAMFTGRDEIERLVFDSEVGIPSNIDNSL